SKGVNATDLLNQGWQQDFEDFTRCEPSAYRRELLENLDTLEAVIHRVVNTYGVLRMKENEVNALKENGSQLHDEILHEHQIESSVKINPVHVVNDSLSVSKSSWIESEFNNALSIVVKETQLQQHESLVTECTTLVANLSMDVKALHADLVVMESKGTKSGKHDTSNSSGTNITHVVDADIRLVYDQVPCVELHLTAQHNVLANEQHHTDQS
ncbi:hypothetical protein Tco_0923028, partial [Tanacetum coccineum]